MEIHAIVYGAIVGISLGLTGGGGSIFAVPLLIYGLGVGVREGVGMSLAAVGATALFGALLKARKGELEYGSGLIFAVAGMAGAPVGTTLGERIPDVVTLSLFALLMLYVGFRMWRGGSCPEPGGRRGPCQRCPDGTLLWTGRCALLLVLAGIAVGILSGIFGVGGGFIIVPALVFVSGISIRRGIATSLMVIALICASGVASYLWGEGHLPMRLTSFFVAGGIAGMVAGSWGASKIPATALRRVFAAGMWAVALFVLTRNLFA